MLLGALSLRRCSEGEAQGELNLTGSGGGAADSSRGGIAASGFPRIDDQPIAGGRRKVRVVRQVEDFGAELEPFPGVQEKLPLERKVHAEDAGGDHRVAAQISELPGGRGRKRAGIIIEVRRAELLPSQRW